MSEEIPSQWTHSIKLEDTQKGLRTTIHCWANNQTEAIEQAISTYRETRARLEKEGIPLAPFDIRSLKGERGGANDASD